MDNKELIGFVGVQRLNDLRRANDALLAHAEAQEQAKEKEKRACNSLFAAVEEFKLIERNMTRYPLWSALRLMGLYGDIQEGDPFDGDEASHSYSSLKCLEPYIPTDCASFPLGTKSFGPLSQEQFSSLEYKRLLSDLNRNIQNALSKCLADNPHIPIDKLKAALEEVANATRSAEESEFSHYDDPEIKKAMGYDYNFMSPAKWIERQLAKSAFGSFLGAGLLWIGTSVIMALIYSYCGGGGLLVDNVKEESELLIGLWIVVTVLLMMVCIGIANSGRKKLQEKQRAILAKQNSLAEKSQRELERAIEIIAGPSNKGQTTTILSQSRQQTQNAQIPTGSTDIDFQCERCGQKLSIDSSWRDSIVECPLCKRNTAVS
jgi:hypothetical protein